MSHNRSRQSSLFAPRVPRSQLSDTGVSPPAFLKVFSSLKRRAVALVYNPSPSSSKNQVHASQVRFFKSRRNKQLKEFHRMNTPAILRRPPTAQSSPIMLSMRAHGLANYPRPPALRSLRRPTSSRRHTPSSSTSSASSAALGSSSKSYPTTHACKRKPVPIDLGDSTVTLVASTHSEPKSPLTPDQEKIAHLQDQIIALQRALSPPPLQVDRPPSADSISSDPRNSGSVKTGLLEPIKRSSVLIALTSSRPSSSYSKTSKRSSIIGKRVAEKEEEEEMEEVVIEDMAEQWDRSKRNGVYDPFAKDTVEIVHALPGFGTSVSLKGQAKARSRPVSEAFTISNVSNTARDLLSNLNETPPPVPSLPPLDSLGGCQSRSAKRSSVITLGQTMAPPASPLPSRPFLPITSSSLVPSRPELEEEPKTANADDATADWTLYLGALDYYIDMQPLSTPRQTKKVEKPAPTIAEDWTLHVPPPRYSLNRRPSKTPSTTAPPRESYLDMTDPERWPSPPPSPSPSLPRHSSRSVRGRAKSRPRASESAMQANLLSPLSLALSPPPQSPSPISPISLSASSTSTCTSSYRSPSPLVPKLLSVSPAPSRSHRRSPSILSFSSTTSFSTTASTSTLGQRASRFFRTTLGKAPKEVNESSSGWF